MHPQRINPIIWQPCAHKALRLSRNLGFCLPACVFSRCGAPGSPGHYVGLLASALIAHRWNQVKKKKKKLSESIMWQETVEQRQHAADGFSLRPLRATLFQIYLAAAARRAVY